MATSVLERSNVAPAQGSALARYLALEATVPVVLFASAAIVVGLHWDIAWHRAIGRDTFWSPPHILEQVAAALAGLFCGWRVLYTSFLGTEADRGNAVRFWGLFHGPLGGWVCIWGTMAMIASAPFDNWWHAAYGLDVKILSPPHTFLLLGMVTVQLGAMLMMLAEQNRSAVLAAGDRRGLVFSASMGLIVLMVATIVYSDTGIANLQHRPLFYQITAGVFPIFLVAAARAGKTRFPATVAALTYSIVLLVSSWVLALVPATPKLAPIYNQITHLTPPGFPLLVLVPAIAIDWLLKRMAGRSDWLVAPVVGVVFVVLLAAAQWPFATFLMSLDHPNYLFATGYWGYSERLGPWTKTFFDVPGFTWVRGQGWVGTVDYLAVGKGLLIAMLFGLLSSRLGLWWGRWMTRVQR